MSAEILQFPPGGRQGRINKAEQTRRGGQELLRLDIKKFAEFSTFLAIIYQARRPDEKDIIKIRNKLLKNLSNEELIKAFNKSDLKQWQAQSDFYIALFDELEERHLTFENLDY